MLAYFLGSMQVIISSGFICAFVLINLLVPAYSMCANELCAICRLYIIQSWMMI
jgi:hypothetical protein